MSYRKVSMGGVGITDLTHCAKVFKALSEPKRAMIVEMLSCGELCACMILEKFKISQSTLSHHMKLLRECRLVKARNEGKWTYYSLDEETIREAKRFFHGLTTVNENCICKEDADCCNLGVG
ncbi:MAG: HTH-type transcriptional repressor CzrA [Syntrophomonadaceae bacterium]|nr:HTH-type transcriptional repressor CzrA [Bacillota bacterium]